MNRPERLNAMSRELVADLHVALEEAGNDPACRVIILTGAGRGFCAGLDLKQEGRGLSGEQAERVVQASFSWQQEIARLVTRMRALHQPVIAAVNGAAAGGGLALALAADIRVASQSAKFNVAFVRIGLSGCDIGVSYLLPRLVGASRAAEMMLTGRIIDATEADRIGLTLKVVPDEDLINAALEVAERIAANSPFGVWMTKEVMWTNLDAPSLQAAIDLENRTQILTTFTGDMREAISAFMEKRPPKFRNR
jgi:enoyl-CoA hydratase